LTKKLFGLDTDVEIKQAGKIEWVRKERFFWPKENCQEEFGCCSLNKRNLLN
jgi:hypothetical protein